MALAAERAEPWRALSGHWADHGADGVWGGVAHRTCSRRWRLERVHIVPDRPEQRQIYSVHGTDRKPSVASGLVSLYTLQVQVVVSLSV